MKRLINSAMPRTKNSAHGIAGKIGLVVLLMLCSQGCGISGSVEEDPTETGQAAVTESVTAGDSSRRELADVNCQAGQYPRWSSTLSNWICSSPEQSLEQILDCKVDQIPTFIGQAWACQDDQTIPNADVLANITNCEKGFTPKWIQGAWLCQPDQWDPDTTIANVDTLRSLSCKEAEKDLLEKTKEICWRNPPPSLRALERRNTIFSSRSSQGCLEIRANPPYMEGRTPASPGTQKTEAQSRSFRRR